jgi:hypothetical protein
MKRNIYIYCFEDGKIRWDFISPTDLDLRCWGKGYINILKITDEAGSQLMELIDSPDNWQPVLQSDLVNGEQGEYHNI